MNSYVAGTAILLTAQFTNALGYAANPTAVTFTVEDGSGMPGTTTPAVSNPEVGTFTATVATGSGAPGVWQYRVVATGVIEAVAQGSFIVVPQFK